MPFIHANPWIPVNTSVEMWCLLCKDFLFAQRSTWPLKHLFAFCGWFNTTCQVIYKLCLLLRLIVTIPFWLVCWDQCSLLLKHEVLKKLVTKIVWLSGLGILDPGWNLIPLFWPTAIDSLLEYKRKDHDCLSFPRQLAKEAVKYQGLRQSIENL